MRARPGSAGAIPRDKFPDLAFPPSRVAAVAQQPPGFRNVRPEPVVFPWPDSFPLNDGLLSSGALQHADQFTQLHRMRIPQIENFKRSIARRGSKIIYI